MLITKLYLFIQFINFDPDLTLSICSFKRLQHSNPCPNDCYSISGLVTNIPPSMVTDQFGMIGLLTFIRAAETDPNLVSLALGADMMMLGLNLNSEVNLYPTFGGPWAETPCRPQDIDLHVPFEYLTNATVR